MFHYSDNLFFGRMSNGSVRILKFKGKPPEWPLAEGLYEDAILDVIVDQHSWCSIIASVSSFGEPSGGFDRAKEFHGIVECAVTVTTK